MASAAAPHTFCAILTASSSTTRATALNAPSANFLFKTPLRHLGFAGVFTHHVATKLESLKAFAKPVRGVASIAKKSVGDLTVVDLKGKKVFVRDELNVPLDDN